MRVSSKTSMDEDEDVEVLEDPALSRKAKKPWTASSQSPQNTAAEAQERDGDDKGVELRGSEGPGQDQSAHVKKFFEGGHSDFNRKVYDMIHPYLQRALATVDSFWTRILN
ncbi:hypothetical protein Fot_36243 [Forsythia ovata]|uniref:Uncharacterized protein n=1 Tax=Forsythia ovata TaxID=205694 RepID=A0ABD1SP50_9LAMI